MKVKKFFCGLICFVFMIGSVAHADVRLGAFTSTVIDFNEDDLNAMLNGDFWEKIDEEDKAATESRYAHINAIISQLGLTSDISDREKVRRVHDYLCDIHNYGELEKTAKGSEAKYVCHYYAVDFFQILKLAGVNVEYVSGSATNSIGEVGLHAWNKVFIDNEWYYIDVTWDDCHRDKADDYSDPWYMISYDEMSKDHIEQSSMSEFIGPLSLEQKSYTFTPIE